VFVCGAFRAASTAASSYGYPLRKERSLHKRIGAQCVQQFCSVDKVARVLGEAVQDEKQEVNILVGSLLLDRGVVRPEPSLKLAQVDDARQQASEMSAKIWQ
jgi:hypothetical protein